MASRITTFGANENFGFFNMNRHPDITHSSVPSVSPSQTSKIALGMLSLDEPVKPQLDCHLYRRGRCHYGEQCKHDHIHRSEVMGTYEPSTMGLRYESTSSSSSKGSPGRKSSTVVGNNTKTRNGENSYPVRNGAADCQYYLKTGKCNYGSRCKFNHPFRDENLVNALNRRDCFDFVQKGTCPYGKSCKYNHPSPQDDLMKSLEHRSDAVIDSSDSSPRSVSLNLPRRGLGEAGHSSRKENAGRSTTSKTTSLRPDISFSGGHQHHSATKWTYCAGPTISLSKKLAFEQELVEAQHPRNAYEASIPYYPANPWSGLSRESGIPTPINSRSQELQRRNSNLLQPDSSYHRKELVHRPHHSHLKTRMAPCIAPFSEFQSDESMIPRDQPWKYSLYGQEEQHSARSVRGPGGSSFGRRLEMSSIERTKFSGSKEIEAHEVRNKAWRPDTFVNSKKSADIGTAELLDFGTFIDRRSSFLSNSKVGPPTSSADYPHSHGEIHGELGTFRPSTIPNGPSVPIPSTSTPLSFMSYLFPDGDPEFPVQQSRKTDQIERSTTNPWEMRARLAENENEKQRVERMRKPQMEYEMNLFGRRLTKQHSFTQSTRLPPSASEIGGPSFSMQRIAEKAFPILQQGRPLHEGYNTTAELEARVENGIVAREHSKRGPNSATYDLFKPTETLYSSMDFEGMANVWQPTDKSPVFGPGLFGMQHHA